jgi:hypothetical protein
MNIYVPYHIIGISESTRYEKEGRLTHTNLHQ